MENFDQLLYAPSDVGMELAKRLKNIRKRRKITQKQLSDLIEAAVWVMKNEGK